MNTCLFPPSFRPMKGCALHKDPKHTNGLNNLRPHLHPMLFSVKFDGIRFLTQELEKPAYSAQLIELPNNHLQEILRMAPAGIEGEIMIPDGDKWLSFNDVQSIVMSRDVSANFVFFVFDVWKNWNAPYIRRYKTLEVHMPEWQQQCSSLRLVPHIPITGGIDQITELTEEAIAARFEGGILRGANCTYKFGRSTYNERGMIKIKPYIDAEATIVGFTELQHNENELETSELGLAKRSSVLAGMQPGDMLGALIVSSPEWPINFKIGTGFTMDDRRTIWANRHLWLGKKVTFKYQEHNTKVVPRQAVFKAFRDPRT